MSARLLGLALSVALACAMIAEGVSADAAGAARLRPDVRLLIDISGSMKESDPDNLRAPALDLIVRLLPEGARAGVWIFGEEVENLVPHGVVDAAWRDRAQQAVAAIDNSGQRTNIPAALAAATYDLGRIDPSYKVSVILLTDGKVDVSASPIANANAARILLEDTAPELGATGIPVHTIALSDEADWSFLRSFARATNGIAEKAQTPDQLTSVYLQSLELVAPAATVPVVGSRFRIDDSVSEFTLLVFFEGEPGAIGLLSPSGAAFRPDDAAGGADWFSNDQFYLVTIADPESGEWELRAPETARTRLTVIADLQLEVDPLPNNLPGDRSAELGIALSEGGEVITDPRLLALFELSVEIAGPGGFSLTLPVSEDYPVPADGEYRVVVPPLERAGRYQVLARVRGETLEREMRMYVEVAPAPDAEPAISTRGTEPPETSLGLPAIALGAVLVLIAVVVLFVLRQRKRRRLEVWARRSRGEAEESPLVGGFGADASERDDTT